ncbi:conserved hypothetical protein [Theileria orientalis strain Shintoku]|uniref:Uncharacterized protein n=1 Tax=Theileria orientalis strain Shintoku TaxID=869250 RepID=J4D616_THEOR|nr:conserved hypothetical protein [Theileria orientalis strain Shintoku]PVC51964.1 hypothetical protein MACL_00001115 [Theileria orientalis]BAM39290.1 conserved hypothetical protein [Theileria orientalis strain Shintoku]|eukprot:XP_009689591.1 conserved hypothetical protein [Theileria orientalis strain Shintoku]
MAESEQVPRGLYGNIHQTYFRVKSSLSVSNIHEALILFHQKLLIGDPRSYYVLLTSTFALLFVLVYAYYRLLELSKSSRSILRRNLERQAILKDRIKNYLFNVLEDSFI